MQPSLPYKSTDSCSTWAFPIDTLPFSQPHSSQSQHRPGLVPESPVAGPHLPGPAPCTPCVYVCRVPYPRNLVLCVLCALSLAVSPCDLCASSRSTPSSFATGLPTRLAHAPEPATTARTAPRPSTYPTARPAFPCLCLCRRHAPQCANTVSVPQGTPHTPLSVSPLESSTWS